jgi:hypothetical protein
MIRKTIRGVLVAFPSLGNITYADEGGIPYVQQQNRRVTGTVVFWTIAASL